MVSRKIRKKHALAEKERTSINNQSKYKPILNEMQEGSQCYKILKYILEHGSITSMECFAQLSITRLSARIYDLRNKYGVMVQMERITKKTQDGIVTYGKYTLAEELK